MSVRICNLQITLKSGMRGALRRTVIFPLFIISLFYGSHTTVCDFFLEIKAQGNGREVKAVAGKLASSVEVEWHLSCHQLHDEKRPSQELVTARRSTRGGDNLPGHSEKMPENSDSHSPQEKLKCGGRNVLGSDALSCQACPFSHILFCLSTHTSQNTF